MNIPHQLVKCLRSRTVLFKAMVVLVLMAGAAVSRAQSGVWTNDTSSVWSGTTNWLSGIVADGSGNTADFTLDNSNFDTVTMDASHSLGTLLFGNNATARTNRWIVNASGGSVLTLAGGTPTIAVSNGVSTNTAIISLPVNGSAGLTKVGSGALVMGGVATYSGNTAVSGGVMKLTNSLGGINTNDALLYYSFDNVEGATVINQGTGGAAMNGTLFGGASVVPGGRYGNALSIPAGNSTVSYLLVSNPVVNLNITAGNNWTVAMWLQTTTPGAAYLYQGSAGWGSGNTEFYLENGTAGDGAGTHAGGVRFAQGWESGTAVINDGAWHFVVMTCTNAVKTIYVDGNVDAFISGVNQWTAAGTGAQVRIGGSASTADSTIGLNGLIDEVYMYNRALGQTEIQTIMNASVGPNDIATSAGIPPGSSVSLAAGSKLDMGGAVVMVPSLTGKGIVDNSLAAGTPTLVVSNSSSVQFDGVMTNSAGVLSFTKLGSGALTLTGTNVYNGTTLLNAGTLNITGAFEPVAPANTFVINGVLNFSGTVITNFNYLFATATNTTGVFYQTTGISKQSQAANGGNFQLGGAVGGYGYYYVGAGATNFCNEIGIGGEVNPSGNGMVDVNGGSLFDSGWVVLARGGSLQVAGLPQTGVLNIYPGSMMTYAGGGIVCNWGSGGAQLSIVNMLGGTVSNTAANIPINLNQSGNAANVGIFNLNGGVIQAGWVNTAAGARFNFNGGTLQAAENQTVEMSGLAATTVYANGGTINNNGFNLTIGQQFLAPSGNGVNGIASFTGGAGYIAPPIVTVVNNPSDTTGVGATAIAQINPSTGVVTNVLITCPGVNYTATPSFVLSGGNPTSSATITGAAPTAIATTGGMTFTGAGTVVMNGGYTYTGPTVVTGGGTLTLASQNVTPATSGNITASGATLNANSTAGVALPVNNLVVINNGTTNGGLIVSSSGSTGVNVGGNLIISNATATLNLGAGFSGLNGTSGLNFGGTVTNNLNYGTITANPTVAAITVAGSVSPASGSTIVLNVSAFGMVTGQFPLIKAGSAVSTPAFATFVLGNLPPGVVATLVNDTFNDSIDLNVTSTGQNLSWYGLLPDGINVSSNWDITVTTNWVSVGTTAPALRYQEYTSGGVTEGDPVTFDDTLFNNGTPATNINLTTGVRPFTILVNNSTFPYTISGPGGIVGQGGIVKSNTGTLTLLTPNTFQGGFSINGGTVVVTNDNALGTNNGLVTLNGSTLVINGSSTNNSRPLAVPATSTIDVLTNQIARIGGTVSGGGGLTKIDNGTLVLAGSNTITGALTVAQGTLNTLGTNILPSVVTVGNTASVNSTLSVSGGNFGAVNNAGQFNSGLLIGSVAGAAGDVRVSGGTLSVLQQFGLGNGVGSYAGFNMTGGALINGSYIVVGFNSDQAVFSQSAGSTTITTNLMTIGAGGTASIGVANFTGGTYLASDSTNGNAGGRGGMYVGETGSGTLNVSGSASVTATGQTNLTIGRDTGSFGTVNLDGGTITTLQALRGTGVATFNFNGGTLKASGASPVFISGLNNTYVYNSGATIDDGGFALTIPQPLLAPSGFGISSIAITPSTSSGYIDTPIVTISGGSGSNATATATVSGGQVTAILVTCPGTGFQPTDVPSVTFSGGGGAVTPPTVGAITFAGNGTGGLTKKGAGTVILTGVNTIGGAVTNTAGTLTFNSTSTYQGLSVNAGTVNMTTATVLNGNVTVSNTGVLSITQIGTAVESIGAENVTLSGGAAVPGATLSLGLSGQNPSTALLICNVLTINGTNTLNVAGATGLGTIPVVKYTSMAGTGTLTNLTLPQGVGGYISNSVASSTIFVVITNTGPGLIWSGTNSTAGLTNLWDINSTTNWLLGSTPTSYHQSLIPGDAVTFNDSGTGTVTLNTNAGPSTLLISNNAVNYTFQGNGTITGPTALVKLGTGAAILNLTNNSYTGDTVASNGTLQAGSASAISAAANLNVGPAGTLELAGFSETVNALNGSGVIDNNGTASPTLTVNTGGTWNGTIHDQGLGGVSLTKNGNNTLVFGGTNLLNSATASQVNAGLTIMTNNAALGMGNSEFWVGAVGGLTSTNIVDGATLVVSNNFLVVGRGSATATGTMIVNHGTVQKSGANVIVVGSLGATGTMIINGGQVLNNSEFWLGESPTAVANLYLNGGLLQATDIRPNNNGGFPTVPSVAFFNGGTLQANASSASFLQVQSEVLSNGLVLDDNGFTLSISEGLADGDGNGGGVIKKGSGAVYFDAANGYTGLTVVSNGLLAGIGSITGPVLVTAAGAIGAGDAGATVGEFTIANNIALQGNAVMRISKNNNTPAQDQIAASGTISYGGVLTVTNATTDLSTLTVGDSFQLFNVAGTPSGNFSSIVGSPGPGLAYSFNPATGFLSVITGPSGVTSMQFTGKPVISGTSLTISGSNVGAGTVYLLTSTNVGLPLANWAPVWTNAFGGSGSFTTNVPNAVNPALSRQFYILSTTNE